MGCWTEEFSSNWPCCRGNMLPVLCDCVLTLWPCSNYSKRGTADLNLPPAVSRWLRGRGCISFCNSLVASWFILRHGVVETKFHNEPCRLCAIKCTSCSLLCTFQYTDVLEIKLWRRLVVFMRKYLFRLCPPPSLRHRTSPGSPVKPRRQHGRVHRRTWVW